MQIKQLVINNVRIIKKAEIDACAGINLFVGENASGKTSILEAISILATTRSFRTNQALQVINYDNNDLIVRANIIDDNRKQKQIAVQREKNTKHKIRINFNQASRLDLANNLPIQVINPKVSDLVFAGSKIRRDFLDWGVFHVKHLDLGYSNRKNLSRFKKALKQRNLCLRNQEQHNQQIKAWSDVLINTGDKLKEARHKQLLDITRIFNENYAKYLKLSSINLKYYQGWSENEELSSVLKKNLNKDKRKGITTAGPHQADVKIIIDGHDAKDFLSRGQTKLLSFLLRLSQMQLFIESQNRIPVLLLDDISAELDIKNRNIVIDCLQKLKIQAFITATSSNQLEFVNGVIYKMFHVKHGKISEYAK